MSEETKEEVKTSAKNKAPKAENKKEVEKDESELMSVLKSVADGLGAVTAEVASIKKDVDNIKTGGANKFKEEANPADIENAESTRAKLDPKISKIVDEMLGEDFGAELTALGDRPGFRFSVIVPPRLSDNVAGKRPVPEVDEAGNKTGKYKLDPEGKPMLEDYMPEDRRSRIVANGESYDVIKQHCEKVRGYIVTYFTNKSQPIPEFKVK